MRKNKISWLNHLYILPAVLLAAAAALALAQAQPAEESAKADVKNAGQALPEQWNGVWKGLTFNVTAGGKREEIPMELHVLPVTGGGSSSDAARTWKILYGRGASQTVRPYEIMPVAGGEPNRFVVDEKNGLFIDNHLVGNVLYSQFMVTTNLVTTRFEIKGDEIAVEMTMFDLRSPRQSKLTGGNIEVASYRFRSVQSGILRREINEK